MAKRKIPKVGKIPEATKRLGSTGVSMYGGYIVSNEKSPDLKGTKKYILFSESIANTGIVAAGIRYFLNLIAKVSWNAIPADDSSEAKQLAKFVEGVIHDIETPWPRIIRRAAMYKFYGFSVQEWVAKVRDDGKIGFKDIEVRPQSTIERWHKENGELLGMWQRSPTHSNDIYLPLSKLLYVVDDSLSASPEGLGLIRHVVPYAQKLKRYNQLETYGFETDLRGIPIGRVPKAVLQSMVDSGKMSKEERDRIERVMKDFIENHIRSPESGLVLDSLPYQTQDEKGTPSSTRQWDLELLKGSQTALPDINKAIERNIKQIAIILGVEHLLLGSDGRGSYALSRDKTHNFFLIIDSTLTELADNVKKDLLRPLFNLNGYNLKLMPNLRPEEVKFRDIEQVASTLRELANAGAPLQIDDPAIDVVRELAGLPRMDLTSSDKDASLIPKPKGSE